MKQPTWKDRAFLLTPPVMSSKVFSRVTAMALGGSTLGLAIIAFLLVTTPYYPSVSIACRPRLTDSLQNLPVSDRQSEFVRAEDCSQYKNILEYTPSPFHGQTLIFARLTANELPTRVVPYFLQALNGISVAISDPEMTYADLSVLVNYHMDMINTLAGFNALEMTPMGQAFMKLAPLSACDRLLLCQHIDEQQQQVAGLLHVAQVALKNSNTKP